MNDDAPAATGRHPLLDIAAEILYPGTDTDPTRRRLLRTRQIVAFAGTAITLVQIIVWLMIALLGGGLTEPWWLWSAVPVALAVAALTALVPAAPSDDNPSDDNPTDDNPTDRTPA